VWIGCPGGESFNCLMSCEMDSRTLLLLSTTSLFVWYTLACKATWVVSGQLFTKSRQLFTESRQLFTESRQLFTESRQLFTESGHYASRIES
jgi:cell division protein FtsL